MTFSEIRIAVANALGWEWVPHPCTTNGGYWELGTHGKPGYQRDDWGDRELGIGLPNFPESLDACAEFEKTLTDEEYRSWHYELLRLRNCTCEPCCRCISALPIERCIAFLKMKGLWHD